MIHATFQQKLDASGNIPGIYNYCNRFCDDCLFTDVCATFKMSEIRFSKTENPDDLARALEESMEVTQNMVDRILENLDFDPDDDDNYDDSAERLWQDKIDDAIDNHRLTKKADEHFDMVAQVFKKLDEVSVPNESMALPLKKIVSFSFHILTKIKRALHGFYEMDPLSEDDFDLFDMNGSAKCLLVMIDDSIALWKTIIKTDSATANQVTEILAFLETFRRETEIQFPGARAFIRGGFDEI